MNLVKRKKQILTKLSLIGATITMIIIKSNSVYATGIGTAEVQTATDNIKRVITSIEMPLRRSFNLCKYCNCSNKDDYKC